MVIFKISSCITAYLCSKGIIEQDTIEIYQYGFEVLVSSIIEAVNVLVLSLYFHCLWSGVLYVLLLMMIRTSTGGYHAETYFRCNIIFITVYIASVFLLNVFMYVENLSLWVPLIFSFIYVVCNAPIQNHNKKLSDEQREKSNKRSIIFYTACVCILLFMDIKDKVEPRNIWFMNHYSLYIKIIMIIIAITMFIGKKKEEWRA